VQHNQIHQQRAAVYQWFSQLLFRELDEKQLASLENGNSQGMDCLTRGDPRLSANVNVLSVAWPGSAARLPTA
jgi:TorA-specific chaperone